LTAAARAPSAPRPAGSASSRISRRPSCSSPPMRPATCTACRCWWTAAGRPDVPLLHLRRPALVTSRDLLAETGDVELAGPRREVRTEVLEGKASQRACGVQAGDDRVDPRNERRSVQPGEPVDGPGQVGDVLIAADGLERDTFLDRLRTHGDPAQEPVELPARDICETVALDVVADEPRMVDQEVDLLPGQHEVPLDVVLGKAAATAAESLARQLLDGADLRALAHEEALRLG